MYRRKNKILHYIKALGLKGLFQYYKDRSNKIEQVFLDELPHPFTLRRGSSDMGVYDQIFLDRDYQIDDLKINDDDLNFNSQFIIDGGANIGLSSIFFANRFPKAKVIAIEPELSNFNRLVENSKYYDNIIPTNKALSGISQQELDVVKVNSGHWSFQTKAPDSYQKGGETISNKITTININDIMQQYGCKMIDIFKLDIECYETELFKSDVSYDWLQYTRCIIIELHDDIRPGSSKIVLSAINQYDFSCAPSGENLVFWNNNPKMYK